MFVFCNPYARAELHQQKRARKLCSVTLRWLLSFTIARALRTKAQVICARSKENVSVFRYFITSTWAQQAKLTVNFLAFPSVKFRKTWQIGSKYFTLVGARFSAKSIRPVFSAAVKDVNFRPHGTVSYPLDRWCPFFCDMRRVLSFGKLLF